MYLCAMKNFSTIAECIKERRSVKPMAMNGKKIDDTVVKQLLELADWAPTHAMTEPWRFVVYAGEAVRRFAEEQAELYKNNTPEDRFKEVTYEKLKTNCDTVSHTIVVYMKRGSNPNIPALEEICATAAAVENLLLGASAAGIAALWSTGGVTFSPAFKQYLNLAEDDQVIGQLYLGYSDSERAGCRNVSLEEKVKWVR